MNCPNCNENVDYILAHDCPAIKTPGLEPALPDAESVPCIAWMGDGEELKAEMARAYEEWWEDTMSGCWDKEVFRVGFIGGYLAGRRAHDAKSPIAELRCARDGAPDEGSAP